MSGKQRFFRSSFLFIFALFSFMAEGVPCCYRDYSTVDVKTWKTVVDNKKKKAKKQALSIKIVEKKGADVASPTFILRQQQPFLPREEGRVEISLTVQQVELVRQMDVWAQQQACFNSKEWFGHKCDKTEIEAMYVSALNDNLRLNAYCDRRTHAALVQKCHQREKDALVVIVVDRVLMKNNKFGLSVQCECLDVGFESSADSSRVFQFSDELPELKRARTTSTLPYYFDVDVDTWRINKVPTRNRFVDIFEGPARQQPTFMLSHKEEPRGYCPFKIDWKTSSMGKIEITLTTPAQISFAERMDKWVQNQALLNSKEWFGHDCGIEEINSRYFSRLKNVEDKYGPRLAINLIIDGADDSLTKVILVNPDETTKQVIKGGSRNAVTSMISGKKEARAAVVVVDGIWFRNSKFGLSLTCKVFLVTEITSKKMVLDFSELEETDSRCVKF